jgi:uncharacterized membrane protein
MEIFTTHLILSLIVLDIVLVLLGLLCIKILATSSDFSNTMMYTLILALLFLVNIIWRVAGFAELTL